MWLSKNLLVRQHPGLPLMRELSPKATEGEKGLEISHYSSKFLIFFVFSASFFSYRLRRCRPLRVLYHQKRKDHPMGGTAILLWNCVHSLPAAPTVPWTLPRAKQVSTGHLFASAAPLPPSSSPISPKRKTTPNGVVFFLVDDIGLEPMTFRTSSGCSSQLS